jgi:hypothetical protein
VIGCQGSSVLLDAHGAPNADQWSFLSAIDKVSTDEFPLDTLAANRGTSGERLIDARAACLCPVFDPK